MPNFSENILLECTGGLPEVMSPASWIMCHSCSDCLIGLVLEYTLGWQKEECKVCHPVSLLYPPKHGLLTGDFEYYLGCILFIMPNIIQKVLLSVQLAYGEGHRFCFHNHESFLLWWPILPSLWECARMEFMRTKEGKPVFRVYCGIIMC